MISNELQKRVLSSLVLIPVSIFFIFQGSFLFIFFLSLLFLATGYEWTKMCKNDHFMKFIGIFFLLFSFYFAFIIREHLGFDFFIWIILICVFTDIGGYAFGKIFKGPKLTKISPNKTYAGVIGSFLFAVIIGLSYANYMNLELAETIPVKFIFGIVLISLISQIGDLIISYFKRKAKLKDTGFFLPGHGGILDRVDGLIFVIPIIYLRFIIL